MTHVNINYKKKKSSPKWLNLTEKVKDEGKKEEERKQRDNEARQRDRDYPDSDARVYPVVVAAHARPILPLLPVARSAQPSFVAPTFTRIYNLIYPFL